MRGMKSRRSRIVRVCITRYVYKIKEGGEGGGCWRVGIRFRRAPFQFCNQTMDMYRRYIYAIAFRRYFEQSMMPAAASKNIQVRFVLQSDFKYFSRGYRVRARDTSSQLKVR